VSKEIPNKIPMNDEIHGNPIPEIPQRMIGNNFTFFDTNGGGRVRYISTNPSEVKEIMTLRDPTLFDFIKKKLGENGYDFKKNLMTLAKGAVPRGKDIVIEERYVARDGSNFFQKKGEEYGYRVKIDMGEMIIVQPECLTRFDEAEATAHAKDYRKFLETLEGIFESIK
jgi:hypothetical protein